MSSTDAICFTYGINLAMVSILNHLAAELLILKMVLLTQLPASNELKIRSRQK